MEALVVYFAAQQLQRKKRYRDPLDPLHIDDTELLQKYRFPRNQIISLCEELEPHIGRPTSRSHAIPTHTQVLVMLRFLASGTFQNVIGDVTGMSQASVSRIISQVTDVLYNKARTEIKRPQNPQEIHQTAQAFHRISGFPRVIGAIDGTHIPIKTPSDNEYIYVNRKGYHSLNLQVVGNVQNLITSYTVKYPGSTHDAYIWNNCPLRGCFQIGVYGDMHLLGDSGYPLEPFLLTPYPHPTTWGQERYNRSHKKTRTIMEQTFGVLKSRFRCLHNSGGSLQYKPKKCAKIAAACMLLHNRCVQQRIPAPELLEEEEQEDEGDHDDPAAVAGAGQVGGLNDGLRDG
ncbi:putative nuclease HARBI1 [Macrobrachium nipponense]|uniref:putative nuclease HARBI1 n=1 Tax=Macrobrachium nipponense TaxID=159736 RepID=UPI0030C7D6E2